MVIMVCFHPSIQGIRDGSLKYHWMLYADNVLLFVTNSEATILTLLVLIQDLGLLSGYRINWEKLELLEISQLPCTTAFLPEHLLKAVRSN